MLDNSSILERERNLIMDEYLNDVITVGERKLVVDRPCTREEVLFNGKDYYLYNYSDELIGLYDITLIPKRFNPVKEFNDDVINFVYSEFGYDFTRYGFNKDTIDREVYSFSVGRGLDDTILTKRNSSYVLNRREICSILEKNKTYEEFFSTTDFSGYLNSHKKSALSSSISRCKVLPLEDEKIETRYVTRDMSSMASMMNSFMETINDSGYTVIDDNETSFFELMKKIKVFKVNIKK